MNFSDERSQVVLVTGASSGIGLALARCLVETDFSLVLTARLESLHILQESIDERERCLFLPLDVTDRESRKACLDTIQEKLGGVDVLVNNAGISYRSVVEHMSVEDEQLQLQTNYFGPMDLIRTVLPRMRRRRFGKIVNISSVAGMMAMPTMGAYSASKFALEGASEALWYELRPWSVNVSLVQIGFIRSQSYRRVLWSERAKEAREQENDDYREYYRSMTGFVEKLMKRARATPESTAQKVLQIIRKPDPPLRVPVTVDAHFFSWLRRLLPRRIYHWILYRSLPNVRGWEKSAITVAGLTKESESDRDEN